MEAPISTPTAPFSALDLFPTFEDQEAVTEASAGTASFDPAKPRKTWADPKAATDFIGSADFGVIYQADDVLYPTLAAKENADGSYSGVPGFLVLSRADAAAYNLEARGVLAPTASVYTSQPPVAIPRRSLVAGEALEFMGPIPALMVVNSALQQQAQQAADVAAGKFTAADRADLKSALDTLNAIAAKVGA